MTPVNTQTLLYLSKLVTKTKSVFISYGHFPQRKNDTRVKRSCFGLILDYYLQFVHFRFNSFSVIWYQCSLCVLYQYWIILNNVQEMWTRRWSYVGNVETGCITYERDGMRILHFCINETECVTYKRDGMRNL